MLLLARAQRAAMCTLETNIDLFLAVVYGLLYAYEWIWTSLGMQGFFR